MTTNLVNISSREIPYVDGAAAVSLMTTWLSIIDTAYACQVLTVQLRFTSLEDCASWTDAKVKESNATLTVNNFGRILQRFQLRHIDELSFYVLLENRKDNFVNIVFILGLKSLTNESLKK